MVQKPHFEAGCDDLLSRHEGRVPASLRLRLINHIKRMAGSGPTRPQAREQQRQGPMQYKFLTRAVLCHRWLSCNSTIRRVLLHRRPSLPPLNDPAAAGLWMSPNGTKLPIQNVGYEVGSRDSRAQVCRFNAVDLARPILAKTKKRCRSRGAAPFKCRRRGLAAFIDEEKMR